MTDICDDIVVLIMYLKGLSPNRSFHDGLLINQGPKVDCVYSKD
jgi:hypothetical protein